MHRSTNSLPFIVSDRSKRNLLEVSVNKKFLKSKLKNSEGIRKFLLKSRETHKEGSLEAYKGPIGTEAKMDYYDSYKKLPAITERNRYENLEDNPNIAYLQEISRKNMSPLPFGVVRSKGSESSINLKNFKIGDNYANAFASSLKYFKQLESLNLNNNRLTERGANSILSKLSCTHLKDLDLSDNKLGENSMSVLVTILNTSVLQSLSLENISAKENCFVRVFQALSLNSTVSFLNVSKNSLNYSAAKAINEFLSENKTLLKLDLHWNKFGGAAGVRIFEGLGKNLALKELDLSWNSIGNSSEIEISTNIGAILGNQSKLLHLDFSYNYFTIEESEEIAKGLVKNHSLLGIHMEGNNCYVNSNGFLVPEKNSEMAESALLFKRIFKEPKPGENCWICEKWVETTVSLQHKNHSPIYIHLEIDQYEPYLMSQNDLIFAINRALPNRLTKFFLSSGTLTFTSSEYPVTNLHDPILHKFSDGFVVAVSKLNCLKASGPKMDMDSPFQTKPRVKDYFISMIGEERVEWTFETSIFKDYLRDTPKLLNDCFEFDWNLSRLETFIKDPKHRKKTKRYLKSVYEYIRLCYKSMSGLSGSEVFSIGSNTLSEFLYECKIIDNVYLINDLGVNWNSANVPVFKDQVYNPGNALVRYEFMEIIVRIASDKYLRSKICKNVYKAVTKIFDDNIIPNISKHKLNDICSYNSNHWRNEIYLCEDVDLLFKSYKTILEFAYQKYSGKKTLPGYKKFMCTDEFYDLCKDVGLASEKISSREIFFCFVQSMMTQVDEYYRKRHFEMSFVEFLEGIARVIDIRDNSNKTLPQKLEAALPCFLLVCPKYISDNFEIPNENTFHSLKYRPVLKDALVTIN